jgi:hypothetical protein
MNTGRVMRAEPPNTRLKLPAPVGNASSGHLEVRRASIPFVNPSSLRRSLSAIR